MPSKQKRAPNADINNVRVQTLNVLKHILIDEEKSKTPLHLGTLIPKHSKQLNDKDQSLLKFWCFEICRHWPQLLWISQRYISKPLKKKDRDVNIIIALGIYQLLHQDIPNYAAISETVELCKKVKKTWAKGLVNGVLRNVLRAKENDEFKNTHWPQDEEITYCHPQWMIDLIKQEWPEHWQSVLEQNNQQPPFTLRVNQKQHSTEDYLQILKESGIKAAITQFSKQGLVLDKGTDAQLLPEFDLGAVSVQDEAPQLAAHLLELEPELTVLDACSAPGGKAAHLLETEPSIDLCCADQSEDRLERLRENFYRLQLNAKILQADLSQSPAWAKAESFDRILLDPPCSASGVIRRHPDIKWLRKEQDLESLIGLQNLILDTLWPLLKPGGILVYATCSIFDRENSRNIDAFIERQDDAEEYPFEHNWGHSTKRGVQLLPSKNGPDGFFYCRIKKLKQAKSV